MNGLRMKTLSFAQLGLCLVISLALSQPVFSATFNLDRLVGYVWSVDCDSIQNTASLWTFNGSTLTKMGFQGNYKIYEVISSSVDLSQQNTLSYSTASGSWSEFIEFNGDQYRVIDRNVSGTQHIKYGVDLRTGKESAYVHRCPKNSEVFAEVSNLAQSNHQKENAPSKTGASNSTPENQGAHTSTNIQQNKVPRTEIEHLGRQILAAADQGDSKKACALGRQLQKIMNGMNSDFITSANTLVDNQCAIQRGLDALNNLTKNANCPAFRAANYQCAPSSNPDACIRRIFPEYNPAIHQYCK